MISKKFIMISIVSLSALTIVALLIPKITDVWPAQSASYETLRAQYFQSVDYQGTLRVSIGPSGDNYQFTFLTLRNQNGRDRLRITVYSDARTPNIDFLDPNGKVVSAVPPKSRLSPPRGGQRKRTTAKPTLRVLTMGRAVKLRLAR